MAHTHPLIHVQATASTAAEDPSSNNSATQVLPLLCHSTIAAALCAASSKADPYGRLQIRACVWQQLGGCYLWQLPTLSTFIQCK